MTEIPCSIQDMTDEEALIQLIVGNIQTENHPLEIGLSALQVVQKDSKKGLSAAAYGEKVGIDRRRINEYLTAAEVYKFLQRQCPSRRTLLREIAKLNELSKLPDTDWLWLHDFIVKHECSKQQVIAIVKAIKAFCEAITTLEVA
jgi:ParB-like chromosome segregation protein Spo0J